MPLNNLNFFNKRIIIAPLDWGMGHTARCVPIIKQLQNQNNTIVVACNNSQKAFLEQEINGAEFVSLFGYNIRYAKFLPLWIVMLFQLPKLCFVVIKEKKWLANYLIKNKIDVVISDNRFGFYNKKINSIFITHQLNIQAPFFTKGINFINRLIIKKYTACWIPDYAEHDKRLSGILSNENRYITNTFFIGPLSRFEKITLRTKTYDALILLSGPEPQRTLLEEKLVAAFANTPYKIALVRGCSGTKSRAFPVNFYVIDVATTHQLQVLFSSSNKIVCRSGYSTLMDLNKLGLKALLIPTPGQSEQEYLAKYWQKKFEYDYIEQKDISKETMSVFMLNS